MPKSGKPNYARGRRVCIFCGGASGARISKEHVFGFWLRDLFPRDKTTTHKSVYVQWPDEAGPQPAYEKWSHGQGHVGSKKLRVLCQRCNNVQLGRLEEWAKEALLPLIVGNRANILPGGQQLLATWAAKTAMIAEHFRPIDSGIPQDDRTWLLQKMAPPRKGWFVWIAAYNGTAWRDLAIYQGRMGVSLTPVARPSAAPHYAQATTFGLGHVLFCVVSSSAPAIEQFAGREAQGMIQIWPPQERSILWPPSRLLNDHDANAVANIIEHSSVFDHSLDPGANWTFAL